MYTVAIEPDGDGVVMLAGHVLRGRLVSVTGAHTDATTTGIDSIVETVVKQARIADHDVVAGTGAGLNAADLRKRFLTGIAPVGGGDDGGTTFWVIGGVTVGVLAVAGAATLGTILLIQRLGPPQTVVVIDASKL